MEPAETVETPDAIARRLADLRGERSRLVVAISGYAGAGKSTLAREMLLHIDGAARIRGDDFLDPTRSHHRSPDWDGVERGRLLKQVIQPFRAGLPGSLQRFDWSRRELREPEQLPDADVLIIDGIGLFHPDLEGAFDLRVWVEVELEIAAQRGRNRDRKLGRQHDSLWDDVWVPNDREFAETFSPREHADVFYRPSSG